MGVALLVAVMGALVAAVLALVPALHIYTVAGLIVLAMDRLGEVASPELTGMFFLGMTAGYAMLNSIPSIFLAAPGDSTVFVVLPGQKYLFQWTQWQEYPCPDRPPGTSLTLAPPAGATWRATSGETTAPT